VEIGGGGALASYKNQVPPFLDLGNTCHLPESSFDFVSYDCLADSPPHREPESSDLEVIGTRDEHQKAVGPASAMAPRRFKVPRPSEALVFPHQPPTATA